MTTFIWKTQERKIKDVLKTSLKKHNILIHTGESQAYVSSKLRRSNSDDTKNSILGGAQWFERWTMEAAYQLPFYPPFTSPNTSCPNLWRSLKNQCWPHQPSQNWRGSKLTVPSHDCPNRNVNSLKGTCLSCNGYTCRSTVKTNSNEPHHFSLSVKTCGQVINQIIYMSRGLNNMCYVALTF